MCISPFERVTWARALLLCLLLPLLAVVVRYVIVFPIGTGMFNTALEYVVPPLVRRPISQIESSGGDRSASFLQLYHRLLGPLFDRSTRTLEFCECVLFRCGIIGYAFANQLPHIATCIGQAPHPHSPQMTGVCEHNPNPLPICCGGITRRAVR